MFSAEQKDAFDTAVKILGVVGAFFSAAGGTYLGVDSIKDHASRKFIMACNYLPMLCIIPAFYIIVWFAKNDVAKLPKFFWGLLIA